jgi:hypothetical protein
LADKSPCALLESDVKLRKTEARKKKNESLMQNYLQAMDCVRAQLQSCHIMANSDFGCSRCEIASR